MCDPATFVAMGMSAQAAATAASVATVVSTVASVGGTLMSAMGAQRQSQAAKDRNAYQAAIDRNNQIIATRRAEDISKRGRIEEGRTRARAKQFESKQLVGLAGQGLDVTEGSNVDLLADTAQLGELDAQTVAANAERRAFDARVQAGSFGTQAELSQARSDAQSPLLAGGSTLLKGAGQVASTWYRP